MKRGKKSGDEKKTRPPALGPAGNVSTWLQGGKLGSWKTVPGTDRKNTELGVRA